MQSAPRSPIAGTPVINDSRKNTGDKANSFPPCLYKFIASDYIPYRYHNSYIFKTVQKGKFKGVKITLINLRAVSDD